MAARAALQARPGSLVSVARPGVDGGAGTAGGNGGVGGEATANNAGATAVGGDGGYWYSYSYGVTSSYRSYYDPSYEKLSLIGFRLASPV